MKKMIKSILVFALALVLLMLQSSNGFAQSKILQNNIEDEKNITSEQLEKPLVEVEDSLGSSGDNLTELFDNESIMRESIAKNDLSTTLKFSNFPRLSNLKIDTFGGKVFFVADLMYKNETYKIESLGTIYTSNGEPEFFSYENLLLADMSEPSGVHFARFWIDNKTKEISLILQILDTKELLSFYISVQELPFDELKEIKNDDLSGRELMKKIIGLYSINSNLLDIEVDSFNSEITSLDRRPNSSQNTDFQGLEYEKPQETILGRGSRYNWYSFIEDVERKGEVVLSNYSNRIDTSFFTTPGWHHQNKWEGNTPYAFVARTLKNGSDENLIQFALLEIVEIDKSVDSSYYPYAYWEIGMEARYVDGMIVNYNKVSGKVSADAYNFGLRFEELDLGMNGLINKAVFTNRTVDLICETKGSFVRAAISLYSPFATAAQVFDFLTGHVNQKLGDSGVEINFGETYNIQYRRYGGKVIRGIVASLASNDYIARTGQKLLLKGVVIYDVNKSTQLSMAYKYVAVPYI